MDLLDRDQRLKLVRRLVALSNQSDLSWSPVRTSQYRFEAGTSRFSFMILSKDEDDLAPFELYVKASDRNVQVEFVDTYSGSEEFPPDPEEEAINQELETLYTMAKTRALGLDNVVDDLFEDLGGEQT